MINSKTLKRRLRFLRASGWLCFIISAVFFWATFSRSFSWLTFVFLTLALIFIFMSIANVGIRINTISLSNLIIEGETSIPKLSEKLKRNEDYINNDIIYFINNGILAGASIKNGMIAFPGIQNADDTKSDGSESVKKTDLNTASENEFAALPGVSVALAKRAVDIRTSINGFTSVQDFCTRLALMPHFTVQIENLAFTSPVQPQATPQNNAGRVVDI